MAGRRQGTSGAGGRPGRHHAAELVAGGAVGLLSLGAAAWAGWVRHGAGVAAVTAGFLAAYVLVAWAAHRGAGRRREALLAEVRAMLMDRVNNSLQVVHAALGELAEERGGPSEPIDAALDASRRIARTVDGLSAERLARWRRRYDPEQERRPPPRRPEAAASGR